MKIDLKNITVSTIVTLYSLLIFSYFPIAMMGYTGLTSFKVVNFVGFTIAAIILVLMTALTTMSAKSSLKFKDYIKNFSITSWFLIGFLAVQLISSIFSPFQSSKVWLVDGRNEGMLIQLIYVVIFLAIYTFANFDKFYTYLLSGTLIIMNTIAIIQLFGINFLDFYPGNTMYSKQYFGVFYSTIGNVDVLGAFYCATVPMVAATYIIYKHKIEQKLLLLAAVLTSVFVIIEINVSATLLGIAVLCAVMLPLYLVKGRARNTFIIASVSCFAAVFAFICDRELGNGEYILTYTFTTPAKIMSALTVVFAILALAVHFIKIKISAKIVLITLYTLEVLAIIAVVVWLKFIIVVDENTNDLLREFVNLFRGEITMHSGSRRIAIWSCSYMIFEKYPIFGVGAGAFRDAFDKIALETYKQYSKFSVDLAHNEYIHIACSHGIVGLIAYLGFVCTLCVRAVKRIFENENLAVILPAIVCYLIQAFFSFGLVFVMPIFMALCGFAEREMQSKKA